MYHEQQKWALCGVHAINNLLQKQAFDKASFDAVCDELAPSFHAFWNPHRSAMGLGNYDVNVLMVLLEREGFAVKWHDVRHEISTKTLEDYYCHCLDGSRQDATAEPKICGIVVNLPSTGMWSKLTKGRHWMTLLWSNASLANDKKCKQENKNTEKGEFRWMNLDSELKEPEIVGDMSDCAKLLQKWQENKKGDCHILLVRK